MEGVSLLILTALVLAAVSGALLVYFMLARPKADMRSLMSGGISGSAVAEMRQRLEDDDTGVEFERVKSIVRSRHKKSKEPTFQEKMFRAGIFTEQQKRDFRRTQILGPFVGTIGLGGIGSFLGGMDMVLLFGFLGVLVGFYIPYKLLNRRIKFRDEEILFYLPLVIEQVAIGVSSSLDIGPCIQRIVQMADERDSHNPVTELVRFAQFHVKTGVGLEEALNEVGKLSGHVELKHAFLALSQVAKFGGEITKQLQELADAVASQRETKIEARIKQLELHATGPVGLVFLAFLVTLITGFGLQVLKALSS